MKIRIGRMILPVLLAGVMTSAAYGGVFDVYYDYIIKQFIMSKCVCVFSKKE